MSINYQTLPNFDAVAAGQKSSTRFATGGAIYQYFVVQFKEGAAAGDLSKIQEVKVILGNDTFVQVSGEMLGHILHALGIDYGDGEIVIPFTDTRFVSPDAVAGLSLGTGNVSSGTLEITLDATANAPSLKAHAAVYGGARAAAPGAALSIRESSRPSAGAEVKTIQDLSVTGSGFLLHSLYINNADKITTAGLALDSGGTIDVRARLSQETNDRFRQTNNRTAIIEDAAAYVMDFAGGEASEMLNVDSSIYTRADLTIESNDTAAFKIAYVLARPLGISAPNA